MSTALQLHTETMAEWGVIRQQAEVLIKTNFLPQSIKTPEQAMAIILTGRELGIGAMQALNTINVIQGKPTISPQLMLALIHRSGQLDHVSIEASKEGAKCMMTRKGQAAYVAKFGPSEAAALGLSGKDNYKKQPATMYKWRAIADAARVVFPDVILGLYTPDEMGAQTDGETGEVITLPDEDMQPIQKPDTRDVPRLVPHESAIEPCEHAFGVPGDRCENCGERVPQGYLGRVLLDAEPEPLRTVKLEGAQPTGSKAQWPKAPGIVGQIFAKCQALNWTAANLADEIEKRFKMVVSEEGIISALPDALTPQELKTLDQALAAEFQNRSRTR